MYEIEVNSKAFLEAMHEVREDQVPFALATALNDVGLAVQSAERSHMHEIFEDRRPQWIDRSTKITHFAKKREPWLTIGIHPPGADGESRKDVLTKFEEDTEKRPRDGHTVAVPVGDSMRRKSTGIIPMKNRPSGLGLHRVGNAVRGERGTFIVRNPDGSGLILQRQGRGRGRRGRKANSGQVSVLYLLLPSVQITPNLHFEVIADRTVTKDIEFAFSRRMDEATRSAK